MIKNPPRDIQIEQEKLTGFYRSIVESNDDPLKAGRVRVRIHGIHSPKIVKTETDGIPVNELPWAQPAFPINLGSVSGIGQWSIPVQGSQVLVFFENGNPSRPIYFASLPGIPESQKPYSNNNRESSKSDGFKDPDEKYPLKSRLDEPDFDRLARGVSEGTIVETKNNSRETSVSTAGGGSWSEPTSPFNAKYPNNHVIMTHGGVIIELDSTPNSKRMHIYHPSNSFIEIDNEGNMVVKNNAEKYEIVTKSDNIYVKQQRNITIDSDSKKKVGGDEYIEVTGNKQEEINGNMNQTIGGGKTENITANKSETIGGNKESNITANKSETIGGGKTENITTNKSETIGGNKTETITGSKTIGAASLNMNISGISNGEATEWNLTGEINLAIQSTVRKLLTELAADVYNSHDHNDPQGGTTTRPNQQITSTHLTQNVKAS